MRRALSIAGIVVAGTVLAGCGAGATGLPGSPAVDHRPEGPAEPYTQGGTDTGGTETDTGGTESGSTAADAAAQPQAQSPEDRAVIVTGELAVRASDPLAVAEATSAAVRARGGRVEQRAESASTDFQPAYATLTVRIPGAEVDAFVDAIREAAEVTRVDLGEQDVTATVRDLEVRVATARASVDRLTQLLATAADTDVLLQVEEQLTQRTSELEALLAEQRAIGDQVAMSTIAVDIRATGVDGPTATPTFWDGLVDGWQAFVAWGATVLYGLGQSIPALVVVALLGLVAWFAVRAILRRRRPRTTQADAPSAQVDNPAPREPVA